MKMFHSMSGELSARLITIVLLAFLAAGCSSSSSNDDEGFLDTGDGDGDEDVAGTVLEEPFGDNEGSVAGAICDDVSGNDGWTDNCTVYDDTAPDSTGEGYRTSYYTMGIQRILFCLDAHTTNDTDISAFADGVFGPNTTAAVEEFQRRRDKADPESPDSGVLIDGIVGPQTWSHLEAVLDKPVVFDSEYAAYSVSGLNCDTEAQFYQRRIAPFDWKMAAEPGSDQMIPFSTEAP